jgi:hypothetical protein
MQRQTFVTVKSIERQLGVWSERYGGAALLSQAEALAVRRDMATLLAFVRDNRVIGTQSTGNMPLKSVREVTARFVNPPKLETTIGDKVYQFRSEEEIGSLYFLHILAEVGGLLKIARARRWQLTTRGKAFLDAAPMLQASLMLAVWWYRVNWLVAYPYTGMGEALPPLFNLYVLASLKTLSAGTWHSFNKFADQVIGRTGLTWGAQESDFATTALRGSIRRMVIDILASFDAAERRYQEKPLGRGSISELEAFKITPFGAALLDALTAAGG